MELAVNFGTILQGLILAGIVGLVKVLWDIKMALVGLKEWSSQHEKQDDERHAMVMQELSTKGW